MKYSEMDNTEIRKITYDTCPIKCTSCRDLCDEMSVGQCRKNLSEKLDKLNKIAIHQVENHLLVEIDKCNQARIKAIKENKINSEIKMWGDMQIIYGFLVKHLETIK